MRCTSEAAGRSVLLDAVTLDALTLNADNDDFFSFSTALMAWTSSQQLMDHLAMHIGQPEITASVPIGESFMIHAEQVQDGSLQVMNIDFIITKLVSQFITAAVDDTTLDAGSCKPCAVNT